MKKNSILGMAAAFFLSFALLSGSWSFYRQTELASRMLRLHVVANSDTDSDQALKLEVRDAVLRRCGELLEGEESITDVRTRLEGALPELAEAGAQVVRVWDRPYAVRVRMEYAPFPATQYEGFALPAGRYQALRVELGAAEGHNWWCVLFPSLCLVEEEELSATAMAQGLTEDDVALLRQEKPQYEIRWKCVELWEELRASLMN